MSWATRYGLNIITDSNIIDDIDINQNIKARIALGRFLAEVLCGGEGVYKDGASLIGDLTGGNNYPPVSIVIYDDNGYPFYFETTTDTIINFDISSGNGILYAVIKKENLVSPDMASANYDDLEFWVYSENTTEPVHSIKLGYGTVVASIFTTYTIYPESLSPVNISSYFYIKGNSGVTKLINSKNIFEFVGENGITITNPSNLDVKISPNLNASGGITSAVSGLAVKLAPSGGLAKDANGLYVSSVAAPQFTLAGATGSNQTITNGNTASIVGAGAISTSAGSTDTLTISLSLSSIGGIIEDPSSDDYLGIKLKNSSGLTLSSSGIDKISSYFILKSDIGNNKSVLESTNLEVYGKDAITTSRTIGNTIGVALVLAATPGLEQDASGLKLKLKAGGGLSTSATGLKYSEYDSSDKYGHPVSGYYEVGDFYRDKSGGLWSCDRAGIPGEWIQINTGTTAEISNDKFVLPTASSFNGEYIPPGYKIRWNYFSDQNNFVTSPTSMVWIWHLENIENNYGFWISEDIFRVKLQRENEAINFNSSNLITLNNDPSNNIGTKHFSIIESGGYGALTNIYRNSVSDNYFLYDMDTISRRAYLNNKWVLNLNDENEIGGTYGSDAQKYTGLYIEGMYANIYTKINNKYISEGITSTTSLTIGTGLQSLIVTNTDLLITGDRVEISYSITPANYMEGEIVDIDVVTSSITVNVDTIGGSGTQASWVIKPNRTIKLGYYEQGTQIATYDHNANHITLTERMSTFSILNRPIKYINDSKELAYWNIESGPRLHGSGDINVTGFCKILDNYVNYSIVDEKTKTKLLIRTGTNIYEVTNDTTITQITSAFVPQYIAWSGTHYWGTSGDVLYKRSGGTTWNVEGTIPDTSYVIYSLSFYNDTTGSKPYVLVYKAGVTTTILYRYDGANVFTAVDTENAVNAAPGTAMWTETQGLVYCPSVNDNGGAPNGTIKAYITDGVPASTLYSGETGSFSYLTGGYDSGHFYLYIDGESNLNIPTSYVLYWTTGYVVTSYGNAFAGMNGASRGISYDSDTSQIFVAYYDADLSTTDVTIYPNLYGLNNFTGNNLYIQEVGGKIYLRASDDGSNYYIYRYFNDEAITKLEIDCPELMAVEFDFDIQENIDTAIQITADIRYMIDVN